MAMALLGLVIGGVYALYFSIQRFWRAASLRMEADRLATLAVNRMVYGYGDRRGLRTARAGSVTLQMLEDGWDLLYVTGNEQTNRFEYRASAGTLMLQPGGAVLGKGVSNAEAVLRAQSADLRVQTHLAEGRFQAGGDFQTTVRWRN
jgi:hypothetical protein